MKKKFKNYLLDTKKQKAKEKKTGFCGSWEDDRLAEEIIRDIKAYRKWFVLALPSYCKHCMVK